MFWKHNRNVDFSYLGDAYAADEAECLERLAEEEVDAAKDATSQDPPNPQAWRPKNLSFLFFFFTSVVCEQHFNCKDNLFPSSNFIFDQDIV